MTLTLYSSSVTHRREAGTFHLYVPYSALVVGAIQELHFLFKSKTAQSSIKTCLF